VSTAGSIRAPAPARAAVGYGLMLAAAVGLFLLIRAYGETLPTAAAVAPPPVSAAAHKADALPHVLLALVAVILTGRVLSWAFTRIGQPPVIGEVVAGILLGPSLLGREASAWVLPPAVAPGPACRSPASPCSWAWRWRSPPSRCWPASSPTAGWPAPSWASSP
jgi:hypothetical protein